jgi:hypothetical protein
VRDRCSTGCVEIIRGVDEHPSAERQQTVNDDGDIRPMVIVADTGTLKAGRFSHELLERCSVIIELRLSAITASRPRVAC